MKWIDDKQQDLAFITYDNNSVALVSVKSADISSPVQWTVSQMTAVHVFHHTPVLLDPSSATSAPKFFVIGNEKNATNTPILYRFSISDGALEYVATLPSTSPSFPLDLWTSYLQLIAIPGDADRIIAIVPTTASTSTMVFVELKENPVTLSLAPQPLNVTFPKMERAPIDLVYVQGTDSTPSIFLVGQKGTAATGKGWSSFGREEEDLVLAALSATSGEKLWWLPSASFGRHTKGYGAAPISTSNISKHNFTLVTYGNMAVWLNNEKLTEQVPPSSPLKLSSVATNAYWIGPPNVPEDLTLDAHLLVVAYWQDLTDSSAKFLDAFVILDDSHLQKSQVPLLPSYALPTAVCSVPLPSAEGHYIVGFSTGAKHYVARMNSVAEIDWIREVPFGLQAQHSIAILPAYGSREERIVVSTGNYIFQLYPADGADLLQTESLTSTCQYDNGPFAVYVTDLLDSPSGPPDRYEIIAVGTNCVHRVPIQVIGADGKVVPPPVYGAAVESTQVIQESGSGKLATPLHIPVGSSSFLFESKGPGHQHKSYSVSVASFQLSWGRTIRHGHPSSFNPSAVIGANMVYSFDAGDSAIANVASRLASNGTAIWEFSLPQQYNASSATLRKAVDLKFWDNKLYALVSLSDNMVGVYVMDPSLATANKDRILAYLEFSSPTTQSAPARELHVTANTSVHVIRTEGYFAAYDATTYQSLWEVDSATDSEAGSVTAFTSATGLLYVSFTGEGLYTKMFELQTGKYLFAINVGYVQDLHVVSSKRLGITGSFTQSSSQGLVYDALPPVKLTGPTKYIAANPTVQRIPPGYTPQIDPPSPLKPGCSLSRDTFIQNQNSIFGFEVPKLRGTYVYGYDAEALYGAALGYDGKNTTFHAFALAPEYPSLNPRGPTKTVLLEGYFPSGTSAVYVKHDLQWKHTPTALSFAGVVRAVNQTDYIVFVQDFLSDTAAPTVFILELPSSFDFTPAAIAYHSPESLVIALEDHTVRCYQLQGPGAPKLLWTKDLSKEAFTTTGLSPIQYAAPNTLVLFDGNANQLKSYSYTDGTVKWNGTAAVMPSHAGEGSKSGRQATKECGSKYNQYFGSPIGIGGSCQGLHTGHRKTFNLTFFFLSTGHPIASLDGVQTITPTPAKGTTCSLLSYTMIATGPPATVVVATEYNKHGKEYTCFSAWTLPSSTSNETLKNVWIRCAKAHIVPSIVAVSTTQPMASLANTYLYYAEHHRRTFAFVSLLASTGDQLHELSLRADFYTDKRLLLSRTSDTAVVSVVDDVGTDIAFALYKGGAMVTQYSATNVPNSMSGYDFPTLHGCIGVDPNTFSSTTPYGCRIVPQNTLSMDPPENGTSGWVAVDSRLEAVGQRLPVAVFYADNCAYGDYGGDGQYVVNKTTGELIWSFQLSNIVSQYLWDDTDRLVVFTTRTIHVFNPLTGAALASIPLPICSGSTTSYSFFRSLPLGGPEDKALLLFTLDDNCLYRLTRETGGQDNYTITTFETDTGSFRERFFLTPTGSALVGISEGGEVFYFPDVAAAQLTPRWSRGFGYTELSPKGVASDMYFFMAFGRYVIALELPTGNTAWMFNAEVEPEFLAPYNDTLIVGYEFGAASALVMDPHATERRRWSSRVWVASDSSSSSSSDFMDESTRHSEKMEGGAQSPQHQPVGQGVIVGTVVVIATDTGVAGVNATTGEVLWELAEPISSSAQPTYELMLLENGLIVSIGSSQSTQIFDPRTGVVVTAIVVGNGDDISHLRPTVVRNNTLYYDTGDVHAFPLSPLINLRPVIAPLLQPPPTVFPTAPLPPNWQAPGLYTGVPTFPAKLTAAPLGCAVAVQPLAHQLMACLNKLIETLYPTASSATKSKDCPGWIHRLEGCVDDYLRHLPSEDCTAGIIYLNEVLQVANRSETLNFCQAPSKCTNPSDAQGVCTVMNKAQQLILKQSIPQSTLAPAQQLPGIESAASISFPYPPPAPPTSAPPTTQIPPTPTSVPISTTAPLTTAVPPTPTPAGTGTPAPPTPSPETKRHSSSAGGMSQGAAAAVGIAVTIVVFGAVAGILMARRRSGRTMTDDQASVGSARSLDTLEGDEDKPDAGLGTRLHPHEGAGSVQYGAL